VPLADGETAVLIPDIPEGMARPETEGPRPEGRGLRTAVQGALARPDALPVTLLSVALSIFYWPLFPLAPASGIDASWRAAVAWAHQQGLQWGRDIDFTYGPLTWLQYPLATSRTMVAQAAVLWVLCVVVLVLGVYAALAHVEPSPTSIDAKVPYARRLLITGVVVALMLCAPLVFVFAPIALVLGLVAVTRDRIWPLWVSGMAIGLDLLTRPPEAIACAAIVGAFALAVLGIGAAVRLLVAIAGTFVVAWLLDGQALGNLPDFAASVIDATRGYATAMSIEYPGEQWQYIVVPIVVVLCFVAAARVLPTRSRGGRVVALLGLAVGLWIEFKEGFVRHDTHAAFFFATCMVVTLGLAIVASDRRGLRPAVSGAVISILMLVLLGFSPLLPIDRKSSVASAAATIGVIQDASAAQQLLNAAQGTVLSDSGMSLDVLNALGRKPTVEDPGDLSPLIAAGANLKLLPALQLYAAYTPRLDQADAAALADGPQVLRKLPYQAIDGRNPYWESPAYQLAVYCRYTAGYVTPGWVVLDPATDRCGTPEPASTVDVQAGEAVSVPAKPGVATLVTIAPRKGLLESAADLLFKGSPTTVTYGDHTWRLAGNPTAGPLLLNAPTASAAFPDLPLQPGSTIAVSEPAHLEFSYVPVGAEGPSTQPSTQPSPGPSTQPSPGEASPGQASGQMSSTQPSALGSAALTLGGTCTLDEVDGAAAGSQSQPQNRSAFSVRGWGADVPDGLAPISTYLVLRDGSGTAWFQATQVVARPDVAAHFGNPALASSGYEATIDASPLPDGDYDVGVAMQFADHSLLCGTGQKLQL
jgi:hypothetical protein